RVQLNLETALSTTRTLHNKVYYTDQNWTDDGAILAAVVPLPGDALLIRAFGALSQRVHVYGDQLDTIYRFGSGNIRHELVVGAEAQELTVKADVQVGLLPAIGLLTPIETAQKPIVFIPGAGFGVDLKVRTLAPYVLDAINISDRWHVSLGGRMDFISQKNALLGLSNKETDFSPFAGVLFAPTNRLSLYANYGEGFNPISLGVVSRNPQPEKSRGAEVGLKTQTLSGRLRGTLSIYQLKKNNIAIVDQTGLVAQLGDQESKGAEIEVNASLAPGLDLLAVYGYTDATLTRFTRVDPFTGSILDFSGNDPTWAPKNVFNSWIGKRFTNGLGIAGGLRNVGRRFVDEANTVTADSYTTLNATVSLAKSQWVATLYLNNLNNAKYETRAFGAVIPAPGRNISLGIRYRM
ncbi:MAG: TonB-dependent receptor, partial [Acidobacteriota bacterium]|nr:TonB-dependent receptor [Acidobacteriota bacterium]